MPGIKIVHWTLIHELQFLSQFMSKSVWGLALAASGFGNDYYSMLWSYWRYGQ